MLFSLDKWDGFLEGVDGKKKSDLDICDKYDEC